MPGFLRKPILAVLYSIFCVGLPAAAPADVNSTEPVAVSLVQGQQQLYQLQVPPGTIRLIIRLSNMSGDLDLYTRFGQAPAADAFDCRPYLSEDADEVCLHENPAPGMWQILVFGYTSGTATLQAEWVIGNDDDSDEGSDGTRLNNNESTPVALDKGQYKDYFIDVPAGSRSLRVELTSMSGDLDLYTQYGQPPTSSSYNCRPYYPANSGEMCHHLDPSPGRWYIRVNGYTAGTAVLRVFHATGDSTPGELNNGETVAVALQTGQDKLFHIEIPSGASSLCIELANMRGDLDLYTRFGREPEANAYDCRPYLDSYSNEQCFYENPLAGELYILVYGYRAGSADLKVLYRQADDGGARSDTGELPVRNQVWSSWYWPWMDSINPNLYDNYEALHRYDQIIGGGAQIWENQNHGPFQNPQSWWGSCHAWSAAACWEPQPTLAQDLGGVQFRISDLKGLLTAAYFKSGYGSSHEISMYRPSPGAFWRLLQDEIQGWDPIHGEPRALIGELYYGDQVWNYPIFRYKVDFSGSAEVSGTIQIWYASDTSPLYAASTELYSSSNTYHFGGVQLEGNRPVDSGRWLPGEGPEAYHRPDAVWRPFRPASWTQFAENPQLNEEALTQILGNR